MILSVKKCAIWLYDANYTFCEYYIYVCVCACLYEICKITRNQLVQIEW